MNKFTVIADFSIVPIGTGKTSVGEHVAAAIKAMGEDKKVRYEVTPMGTILESERLEDILDAVRRAHEVIFSMGVKRVESILKIDDRRDKPRIKEDKVRRIEEKM